jgi:hypothetical protein
MIYKPPEAFFNAVDVVLDKNGLMSVCIDCMVEKYNSIYQVEHTLGRSLLRTCRLFNVAYDPKVVETVERRMDTAMKAKSPSPYGAIGYYMNSIRKPGMNETSLTFVEPDATALQSGLKDGEVVPGTKDYLEDMWGQGYSFEDYQFLEKELSEWKETHKSDTKAEMTLLKEICHKVLEIRKKRLSGDAPATAIKELQELMKTASIDPAKSNSAGIGKSMDAFSSFIKKIEETEPASYYKDKGLFDDFDNLDFYFKKYVQRPLKNFITGSRDFNVTEDEFDDGDDDITPESFLDENQEG